MNSMAKREKAAPMDGLGPRERKKIDSAMRQVWYRSKARALCVKRCTNGDGFTVCEQCGQITPKIKIDHVIPCGPVDSHGFMIRLFCPSHGLQALCKKCHDIKTKLERQVKKDTSQKLKDFLDLF
jgi:hypothetical protein